jgi:hypothetical protein
MATSVVDVGTRATDLLRPSVSVEAPRLEEGVDPVWTPFTLADLWRVDIAMIIALLEKGTLKGTFVDGEWQITSADIDEYLERKRGTHAP